MFEELSDLKAQLEAKQLDEAVRSAREGRHADAASMFGRLGIPPGQQARYADDLAYAFYRRALAHQSKLNNSQAIDDLEAAQQFPSLPQPLKLLIQQRLTALRKSPGAELQKFDEAVRDRFGSAPSNVDLRLKFLNRFGLSQAYRSRTVEGIDEISAVGVYRWAGDRKRGEQWSQLIRQFKAGDEVLPAFFGRILAEHFRATTACEVWTREVDYIVPVPAVTGRTAERGMDIVGKTGEHLSSRLRIPMRPDFLKRRENSERSRFVSKTELASQYSFDVKKAPEVRGRTILLFDDVMNRGHSAGVCALRLRENGCSRVVLLVLALAESSLQSSRHTEGRN